MPNYNGGFSSYPDKVTKKTFFRAVNRATKTVTVKQGQVLKKHSFLESDANGKCVAHSGMNEKALVTFGAITLNQTVILAGLTFTAGASGCSKADLITAWSNLAAGTTAAAANTQNPVVGGSFTAGTFTGYTSLKSSTVDSVLFISTSPNTDVANLANTGTATTPVVTVSPGSTTLNKIAGVLLSDVDATLGDTLATAYSEASFYASALVWSVTPASDTIVKPDGTTVACTDYYTGATSDILKAKFVENTDFKQLGFLKAGEDY